jgi:hypothetical protein
MNAKIERIKNIVLGTCLLASGGAYAQENSTITNTLLSPFKVSGYVETYYSATFSESFNDRKSLAGPSYQKNDEPAISLAFLKYYTILKISKLILH